MKLAFRRSKMSKEQLERQAGEELEAAMARATPPAESERTWAHGEAAGDWRARSTSLQERVPAADDRTPAPPGAYQPEGNPSAGADVDELRSELWAEAGRSEVEIDLDDVDLDDVDLDDVPTPPDAPVTAPASSRARRPAPAAQTRTAPKGSQSGGAGRASARRSAAGKASKAGAAPVVRGTKKGGATATTRKAGSTRARPS